LIWLRDACEAGSTTRWYWEWSATISAVGGQSGIRGAGVAVGVLPLVAWAEWLSAAPAVVHLWAAGEHLAEWWGYGAFYVASAVFQGSYALGLERWHRRDGYLIAGIAANLSIVVLWIVSRTAGMPRPGPESGHVHAVGRMDAIATLLEVGLVAALAAIFWLLPRAAAKSARPSSFVPE